jgi:hypothetical protein
LLFVNVSVELSGGIFGGDKTLVLKHKTEGTYNPSMTFSFGGSWEVKPNG